jgi:hypothetical protein
MSYHVPTMKSHQPGTSPTWEAGMTTAPQHVNPPIEVTVMDAAEWKAAVQRTLDDIGYTFEQLAEMAGRRDFVSSEARKVWLAIGGKRP